MTEQRNREPFINLFLFNFAKWSFISPFYYTYFRGKAYGLEKVPKTGPLVVVCNHGSYYDPPLLSTTIRRPVSFMAKEELFNVPVLKQLIRLYGAYPVKRGSGDRQAIRLALNALKDGWAVGLFLEGTRTNDGRIYEPKLGAALIAAKANAPILPVSLWGVEKIVKKGSAIPQSVPLTLRVGDVIPPPTSTKKEELEEITNRCCRIINEMHDLGR
jgi:1-acyl-sn-glycerol-3-phosphate acyltransferase